MESVVKICFLVTILLGIVSIHSEASPVGDAIDQSYQADLDDFDKKAAIGGAGNIVIQLGQAAIDIIEKEAEKAKAAGAFPEGVDVLTDGLVLTIKLIAENGDDAFDLIDKYRGTDKYINDPEEAIIDIQRGMRVVKDEVYHSGVPILHAMGACGVITPGVRKSKLKESMDPIQDSGTAIFDGMEAAEILATQAFKSTKRSRDQSIKAAHNAVIAGTSALNSDFVRATESVFAYLVEVAKNKSNETDVSGDVLSNRAKALARDNETLAVIEGIDLGIIEGLLEGLPQEVLREIREGVLGDIETSANGLAEAFKAINQSMVIGATDKKTALSLIKKGMAAARKGCIDGSVQGYQGFGGAAHFVRQKKVFSAAIEQIESSRIGVTAVIEAALKLAKMALIAGGDSLEQGLMAAHDAIEAAEIELYTKISNAQKVALTVLKAVNGLPGLI